MPTKEEVEKACAAFKHKGDTSQLPKLGDGGKAIGGRGASLMTISKSASQDVLRKRLRAVGTFYPLGRKP